MTTTHASRRWKGCPMCGIHKDSGQSKRTPWPALKKLGRDRRLKRHYVPDLADELEPLVDDPTDEGERQAFAWWPYRP